MNRLWMVFLLCMSIAAEAVDTDAGVAWLQGRLDAGSVHAPTDINTAPGTDLEVLVTLRALSATSGFSSLRDAAIESDSERLDLEARRGFLRLEFGQASGDIIDDILASQNREGGIPSFAGYGSEPLASALMLETLDRAGDGTRTPASRILGYLLSTQNPDGGWSTTPGGPSSVFVSAQVSRVLAQFRSRFQLTQPLNQATVYLLNAQDANDAFGEDFESALAIEALLTLGVDTATLADALQALDGQQLANGSFADDAYITAVALRALWRSEQPVTNPDRAGITGRVIAADTELPINGAVLDLTGPTTGQILSNNVGEFQLLDLPPGDYAGTLSFAGMQDITFTLTLVGNRILDMGTLRMYQGGGGPNLFAIIRGTVTSAQTGEPVSGASVVLESPMTEVTTDADGRYQFLQVPGGANRVTVTAAGFCVQSTDVEIEPQSVLELSVRLNELNGPLENTLVRGTVTDGVTGDPLQGVTVEVVSGAPIVAQSTSADGGYELEVEADGVVSLMATLSGFDPVMIDVLLTPGQIFEFSPRMYPEGQTPVGANRSDITGVVVNQANRQPIFNALVIVTDPAGQQTLRTDEDGRFRATALQGPTTRLAISADAFDPATILVPILPLETRDVGEIGLKPTLLQFYFADLAITASTLTETDPDSFLLNDQVTVEVANRGTAFVEQDFTVVAFVDANDNGVFDQGTEPEVGRSRFVEDLPIGGSAAIDIALDAQLSFRDAQVDLWVDAENEVPEQDEENNVASTLLGCRVTPAFVGDDTVYEAWRWDGLASDPTINSVNQVPSVGQLTDDNGDGVINQYDIPDIVFVAGRRSSSTPNRTAIVAISGEDGSEIWSRTDILLSQFSGPALADIDNDGVAEIVAVRNYRQELVAYENDGSIKWRTPLDGPPMPVPLIPPPPYVYDTISIVNLIGDNEAEIIYGREVFRGLTGEQLMVPAVGGEVPWEGAFDAGGADGGIPLEAAYGIGSVAADVNLDGLVEVIAGRTLYDVNGNAIWHRDDISPEIITDEAGPPRQWRNSGYTAVGNFDLDDFAEIVLSSHDELYLLEHTGDTIWGPVFAPDFGQMGAPSVADLDDDGLPEIIISSNQRLTVFESDGTVKWTANINDDSGVTSATVFDFENDGLLEVIHLDEEDFRIFDALTGTQLYETRHTSRTVFELPVVADVDGDKEAEIIIAGFDDDLVAGVTPGIRVFKARNGAWADAGSIWGSQTFHINEVNEDSTIPLLETPSWLTHNTYRVQRSPLPDPLGLPDFTVGDLRLIDQGPGMLPRVQIRAGNAGPVDAHEPPFLGVYRGDPDSGGVLLAERRLDTLRADRFQIITFDDVALTGSGDLFAVIDQPMRARECREGNNRRVTPFSAANATGQLSLASDAAVYAPGDSAMFEATVTNTSELAADFTVDLRIESAGGEATNEFDPLTADALAGLSATTLLQEWSTLGVLAGDFVLVGELRNAQGTLLSTQSLPFAIQGAVSGLAGDLTLLSSLAVYNVEETPILTFRAANISSTDVIESPEVRIEINGPGGFFLVESFPISDLAPGGAVIGELAVDQATSPGIYTAQGTLSSLTAPQLAQDTADFERLADPSAQIVGTADALQPELFAGFPQECLFTAGTATSASQANVNLRLRVVSLTGEVVTFEDMAIVDLTPGNGFARTQAVATNGYLPGDYACVIETAQGAGWRVLDFAGFTILGTATPEIVVTPTTGLVTTEAGQAAQFTVSLTSPPSASVSINLQSSDSTEFQPAVTSITFNPVDWDIPRSVSVLGVDDTEVDGDQIGMIQLLTASSGDGGYDGIDPQDVEVTNLDDDRPQVLVSPTTRQTTSEAGTSFQFMVSFTSEPTDDVTVDIQSSDATEWTTDVPSLTFSPGAAVGGLFVTVTGVDDDLLDGDIEGLIEVLPASSSDLLFDGLDGDDVPVINLNDDGAIVIVDPLAVTTSEAGQDGSFTVRLNAAPAAAVTIPIGVVDTSEWLVIATDVVLDDANWETGVEVTVEGVDDTEPDGDQVGILALGVASSDDLNFAGIDPVDVVLTNLDNDSARIEVNPTNGLIVSETGTKESFVVTLSAEPTAPVNVPVMSGDDTEFAVDQPVIVLDSTNWSSGVNVLVTGVDDAEVDGNVVGQILLGVASGGDPRYAGINVDDVTVTNADDETLQIIVSPNSLITTDETGTQADITVAINAEPTAEVRIPLSNPDASEWSLSALEIRFDAQNWQQAQRVTVTGLDDDQVDGNVSGAIGLLPAESGDPQYAGINPPDVIALNRDDDSAAVIFEMDGAASIIEGEQTAVRVRLASQPASAVTFDLASSHPAAELVQTRVTIEPALWQEGQPVSVLAVDDDVVNGDRSAELSIANITTADAVYASQSAAPLSVTVIDNDQIAGSAAVLLSVVGNSTVTEGETAQVQVRLASEPTDTVNVSLAASDGAILSPDSASIDSTNWQQPVTISLPTTDDAIVQGTRTVTVMTDAVTSADMAYDGLSATPVAITILDNDSASVDLILTGPTQIPEGGATTLRATLSSQPSADVQIQLQLSEVAAKGLPAYSLQPNPTVLNADNWDSGVPITFRAEVLPGTQGIREIDVQITQTQSSDAAFAGLQSGIVTLQVVDAAEPIPVPVGPRWMWVLLVCAIWVVASANASTRRSRQYYRQSGK